ncbi:MAG: nucleotidyltransferase domain-containing protein [Chlamydiae bacterium]|nr:nucleotidyltransferase domain-containing protein [Chlamydiota bacterium]MBI3276633.1 nucleotidyltransferase domain-containing protein [Chlamydiota bacterium]
MAKKGFPETQHRGKEIINRVCHILLKYLAIKKIILFGSRGKGTAHLGSDFDFAVDTTKPGSPVEMKIMEEIEEVAGLHQVDIIYLRDVEKDFKKIVLKTGRVIYER